MFKIFNTLSRKKEIFKPIQWQGASGKGQVGLYACGPTVYNYAHIGNLRTYIFEDILRRTLEANGYKIRHVVNITDVDDKIIQGAINVTPFLEAFFEDLRKLNIKKAWKYPKATEHIPAMIALIKILLHKKFAYIADNGVYFDISKFKRYGKLSKTRLGADEGDFALWKFKKPGEPAWKAPFGEGRPGWHIECSAMSMKYLGEHFDIHTGGVDLIFPHHENEIAQSESATNKKFVNYFLEGEHLLVDSEKMSKSLGNIFTLRDLEKKKINPLAYRYFVLGAHYRSKLNFTWEALEAAQNALERLYEVVRMLNGQKFSKKSSSLPLAPIRSKFFSAINDDLNTPQAFAIMWKMIKEAPNLKLLYEFDEVLGFWLKNIKPHTIPLSIKILAQKREQLRKEKKWNEADKIREQINKKAYMVKDTADGAKISPVFPLL